MELADQILKRTHHAAIPTKCREKVESALAGTCAMTLQRRLHTLPTACRTCDAVTTTGFGTGTEGARACSAARLAGATRRTTLCSRCATSQQMAASRSSDGRTKGCVRGNEFGAARVPVAGVALTAAEDFTVRDTLSSVGPDPCLLYTSPSPRD